jgi:hypothetical protein
LERKKIPKPHFTSSHPTQLKKNPLLLHLTTLRKKGEKKKKKNSTPYPLKPLSKEKKIKYPTLPFPFP